VTLDPHEHVAFAEPSLVVHAFAPLTAGSNDRNAAQSYLRSLWEACGGLGMSDAPLPGVDTSFVWPDSPSAPFEILAARGTPGAGKGRQGLMFRRHDVVGLAIAFDDPASSKDLDGWRELLETWKEATGELAVPGALLGETFTFLCAYDAPSTDPLRPAVERAMHPCGLRLWNTPYEPQSGIVLWDGEEEAGRRVVAALAPLGSRDELSRLFWWAGEQDLARMVQYQVHAAKVRYEERVHAARKTDLATAIEGVARAVDESLAAHRDLDARSTSTIATAERRLIEAQADSAGLVIQLSYFRALQRTIDIARHNMALVSPGGPGAYPDTMIDRDRALAMRLSDQIEHDIGYAEAVGERAQHATSLSSLRLQQSQERLQAGRSRLVLFQTALLSALLTGIGAIATFDLSLDVAGHLRFPLLATLVTVLLAAPIVAASWHDGFRPLDRLVIGLLGGSLAWLGLATALPSAPWFAAMAAVAAGVGLSQLLASRHLRRGDEVTT
jgi:hypothetical protein